MRLSKGLVRSAIREPHSGIFVFEAFTSELCSDLLAKIKGHEPSAPNSMNKYGLVLDEIGLSRFRDDLVEQCVDPLSKYLFPEVGRISRCYGFVVQYEAGPKHQRSLSYHYDESDVTLNVCLGEQFTGGGLVFQNKGEIEQSAGQAVLHLGSRVHRAAPIFSGTRTNLVLWCRGRTRHR